MRRFMKLVIALSVLILPIEIMALAVHRWLDELELWNVLFGEQHDREFHNHDPWGDAGLHCDPATFEQ